MRITIATFGSRGDVQPYIALGLGLKSAGHDVRLGTYGIFDSFVSSRGLELAPVVGDPARGFGLGGRGDPRITRFGDFMALLMSPRFVRDCLEACRGADVIIASQSGSLVAHHVAEKLGVPIVWAFYVPLDVLARPGPLGRLARPLGRQLFWLWTRARVNRARREALGLPPLPLGWPFGDFAQQRNLLLYGYSPAVVPRSSTWGDWIDVTGYWFLDRPPAWQPPDDLVAFLEEGPQPVFVGFGGAPDAHPSGTSTLIQAALAQAGQRGVVLAGSAGGPAGRLSDSVYMVDDVPFDWLFPRMKLVVHHGGAGTTAAGLRAGVPSVIVPSFADQPLWGRRIWDLGVGPPPLPRKKLSTDALAAAIRSAASDPEIRRRAAALGERIRAEDGVSCAVKAFERRFGAGQP